MGAMEATFPTARVEVRSGMSFKSGMEAHSLLRERWDGGRMEFALNLPNGAINVDLRSVWDLFHVEVSGGDDAQRKQLHELVRDTLGLLPPTESDLRNDATLYSINQRILTLHDMLTDLPNQIKEAASSSRMRCFVSFRFDEHSKALALELRNFLELADLEFVSGLGYEPRSVSEKVLDRLTGSIDLFLVIFTIGGDSAWLHQEIGVAKARGLPIVVLREATASFNEGLLSDIEYASFPENHVSGAFIPVLQAVQYVRLKSRKSGQ